MLKKGKKMRILWLALLVLWPMASMATNYVVRGPCHSDITEPLFTLTYSDTLNSTTRIVQNPTQFYVSCDGVSKISTLKIVPYVSGVTSKQGNKPTPVIDNYKEGLELFVIEEDAKQGLYSAEFYYHLPPDIEKKEVEGMEISMVKQRGLSGKFSFLISEVTHENPACYKAVTKDTKHSPRAAMLCLEASKG